MTRRIYLDLDGVMADFDGTFPAVFGLDHRDMADDAMWLKINGHPSFFRDLPPMAGAVDFFRSIEHLDPIILTACPKSNYAHVATQKVEWVRAHLSAHVTVLPVLGGSSKPLFMHAKGDILIDDFRRNTEAWAAAGGHAILHRGFDGTAAALAEAIGPYARQPAQPVGAVDEDSREFVLRAMALNYTDRHAWDELDTDACRRGADEIKALRAALRAALAHLRPTGDANSDQRRHSAVVKLLELGWDYQHEKGWFDLNIEQAGEVVGEVILFGGDADLKEVSWRGGKLPPVGTKLYAQPLPVGVPDGAVVYDPADADMFWPEIDPDQLAHESIAEVCSTIYSQGAALPFEFTVQRAIRLPDAQVRMFSTGDDDWDYEVIAAAPAPAKAGEA